jgi:hypothetical protein
VANCRGCGHPIRWVDAEDGERRISLEVHAVSTGPDRYVVDDSGVGHPISDDAEEQGYQLHICNRPIRR